MEKRLGRCERLPLMSRFMPNEGAPAVVGITTLGRRLRSANDYDRYVEA